jgi:beta-glucosidase
MAASTPAQYPGVDGVANYSEGVFVGYRHFDAKGIEPLFPFGHGLSYTTFKTRNLHAWPAIGGHVVVTADVTNTGKRAGTQVVQLYVGHPADPKVPQPPRQLGAFTAVDLKPGQTKHVVLPVTPRAFAHWDAAADQWVISGGRYTLHVGSSSRDLPLSTTVRLHGMRASSLE